MQKNMVIISFDHALRQYLTHDEEVFGKDFEYQYLPKTDLANPEVIESLKREPRFKVAIISDYYSSVDPGGNDVSHLQVPPIDLSSFDLILVCHTEALVTESTSYITALHRRYKNEKILVIASSLGDNDSHPNIYILPWFLFESSVINTFQDTYNDNKPRLFDALLGTLKLHRLYIYQELKNCRLLDRCFVNILASEWHEPAKTLYCSPELIKYESAEALEIRNIHANAFDSYQRVSVNDINTIKQFTISGQVPWEIYKKSHYSIIAETIGDGPQITTEKTAKALFAKRIFVMFGAKGQLSQLHSYGYRTFDGLVDERYDQIDNPLVRWKMAMEQVKKLAESDPAQMYYLANDILEHNYNVINDRSSIVDNLRKWIWKRFYLL